MSGALAIAGVTGALLDLLNNGLVNHDLAAVGNVTVSASPPDRITMGAQEPDQLNLFLYQVTPNLGWRNADLPSRDGGGTRRLSNPPLALDLHYLLTAYGSKDMNAEILLGHAMHILHENPCLTRTQLRTALGDPTPVDGTPISGIFGNLSAIDLADQVELIKITPAFLNSEELSKLWTAMQARYRPTMGYLVSVVLIQATGAVQAAPPVLKRGKDDRGAVLSRPGPAPALSSVRPAASASLPAMRLGDELLVSGNHLDTPGDLSLALECMGPDATAPHTLPPLARTSGNSLSVMLPSLAKDPDVMRDWRIGVYRVTLLVAQPEVPVWRSNAVPIALAPIVSIDPAARSPNTIAVGAEVTLTCTPRLTPTQEKTVRVLFGAQQVTPSAVTTPADDAGHPNNHRLPTRISFRVPALDVSGATLRPGDYLVRLRVDGIDSLPVTLTGSPATLVFDVQQQVTVA